MSDTDDMEEDSMAEDIGSPISDEGSRRRRRGRRRQSEDDDDDIDDDDDDDIGSEEDVGSEQKEQDNGDYGGDGDQERAGDDDSGDAFDEYNEAEGKQDDDGNEDDDDDYYSDSEEEIKNSTRLVQSRGRASPSARQRNQQMLQLAKTKKKGIAGSTRRSGFVETKRRGGGEHSSTVRRRNLDPTQRKKAMERLTRAPKRVSQEQFIKKNKAYTFKPKLIAKFKGNKIEMKEEDEDPGKKFEKTLGRFEAKSKSVREKLESRRGELDYNARNDKKVCDRCESEQSFDEWRGKKTTCSSCEVGRFVVRRVQRDKVCYICGQRQPHPNQTHCSKHPEEAYKQRSVTQGAGYKRSSKVPKPDPTKALQRVCPMCHRTQSPKERRHKVNKCRKCKVAFVRPATLPQTSELEVLNSKELPRKVVGFMDRMQVDVELRDIKQRRAMQVQESERASKIAHFKKKRNKVVNPYAASSSFLERVEQDLEMRRSVAARTIKMKIDHEDAQLAYSSTRRGGGDASTVKKKRSSATRRTKWTDSGGAGGARSAQSRRLAEERGRAGGRIRKTTSSGGGERSAQSRRVAEERARGGGARGPRNLMPDQRVDMAVQSLEHDSDYDNTGWSDELDEDVDDDDVSM